MQEESKHKSQEDFLMHACEHGTPEDFRKLIALGIDINSRDRNGSTVLFHCCHPQQLELIRYLLSIGANPNITNVRGNSPLHLAAERGFLEVILILILNDADPYIYNLNGHRCDDLNPSIRPIVAGIFKDKSAFKLLTDFHRKRLTLIFQDIASDEATYIDAAKSIKFNRFIDETTTEDAARRDAQEFLREVSICKSGQVNLEE